MKKFSFFVCIIVFNFICVNSQTTESPEITKEELKQHISFLASEECEGRKPGTKGDKLTSEYIRKELLKNGLKPLGDNAYQQFDVLVSIKYGPDMKFAVGDKSFEFEKDFLPVAESGNATASGKVVFAGYGLDIDTEKVKWNDFENLDVAGKWIMIFMGSPSRSKFMFMDGLKDKLYTAKTNKAIGVILVNGHRYNKDDDLIGLSKNLSRKVRSKFPVVNVKREIANMILAAEDLTVEELEEHFHSEQMPYSFETEIEVSATTNLVAEKNKTQNIIALVEGSDPVLKNEYVVIGAHHDHLGYGGPASGSRVPDTTAVHYGADDNASGVATVIEIAEKLQANRKDLKRSVIAMTFASEEQGLIGSKFFVNNPLVDLKNVKAMFNFDMVGRLDKEEKRITIAGTGTAEGLQELVDAHDKNGLKIKTNKSGFGPSDYASFYSKNIPVLAINTGLHTDYHTPADKVSLINFEGQKTVSDYAYSLIKKIANLDKALEFKESGAPRSMSSRPRFKVTMGIMPDVSDSSEDGMTIDGVMDGKPAKAAGLKKGDKIVAMDGEKIGNIYDYMNKLKKFKTGQKITVEVIRNGENKIFEVQF